MHEKDGGEGGKLQSGKTDALQSHIPDKTLLEGIPAKFLAMISSSQNTRVLLPQKQVGLGATRHRPCGTPWSGKALSQSFYSCS